MKTRIDLCRSGQPGKRARLAINDDRQANHSRADPSGALRCASGRHRKVITCGSLFTDRNRKRSGAILCATRWKRVAETANQHSLKADIEAPEDQGKSSITDVSKSIDALNSSGVG